MNETKERTDKEIADYVKGKVTEDTEGSVSKMLAVSDCLTFEFPSLTEGARRLLNAHYKRMARVEFQQNGKTETMFLYPK